MSTLLNDPEFDKLLIYGLAGVCAVLLLAVFFLAIKRNIYYIDEDGQEVPPPEKKRSRRQKKEEPAPEPVKEEEKIVFDSAAPAVEETVVVPMGATRVIEPIDLPQPETEEPEEEIIARTLEVPVVRSAAPKGLTVEVTVRGETEEYTIDHLPCLIGRDEDTCDLPIAEPAVSRRHARLAQMDTDIAIEDVSGHNGTYLNGIKLPSLGAKVVHEGDRISLGRAEIKIVKFLN